MRGKRLDGFVTREKALQDFFEAWVPAEKTELVPLDQAAERISAKALESVNTLPVHRVSSLDGIAVESARFAQGMPDYSAWQLGREFVRADTGDDFDDRFDAIIPIEEADLSAEGRITFISPDVEVAPGSHIRARGSTVKEGDPLIGADLPIRPTDLASLALGGIAMVPVRRKPRVAFIPTGTELIPYAMRPKRGENVDTNSLMVREMLLEMGAEPLIFPIVPDVPEALQRVLQNALAEADVVILNAGTAKGSEDFNADLLGSQGRLIHHYIAAAPGRPMALFVIDNKPVVNLPGPVLAAFFGMDWCVRAVVHRFLHLPMPKRERIEGVLMEDIRSTPHMAQFTRVNAVKRQDGTYELYPLSSHKTILPLCMASNALYVCEVGENGRSKGEILSAELLRGEEYLNARDA